MLWHYRPLNYLESPTFQIFTFQNLAIMDKHPEFAVCSFPNIGMFGKLESLENMFLLLQPLWVTVLSLGFP